MGTGSSISKNEEPDKTTAVSRASSTKTSDSRSSQDSERSFQTRGSTALSEDLILPNASQGGPILNIDLPESALQQLRGVNSSPEAAITLTSKQREKVCNCLSTLEEALEGSGVYFDKDYILTQVEIVVRGAESGVRVAEGAADVGGRETLRMDQEGDTKGIFVVDEGEIEILSGDGKAVMNRLVSGDFCGELTSLFRIPSNAQAQFENRVSLLLIPTSSLSSAISKSNLTRDLMVRWCVKKSYIDFSESFGPGVLSQMVIANCLKKSIFSVLGADAINFIAGIAQPLLFDKGEVLYSINDEPSYIFLILRGPVECTTENGRIIQSRNIRFSDEGFCIGENELFKGKVLTHQAKAVGPLLAVPIGREILLEMINKFPSELSNLKTLLGQYSS